MGLYIIWPMQNYSYSWIEVYPPREHMSVIQEQLETGIDSGPQKHSGSHYAPRRRTLLKTKTKKSTFLFPRTLYPKKMAVFLVTQEESIFVLNLDYDYAPDEEESSHSPTELINWQGQLQNWLHSVCGQSHIAVNPLPSRFLSSWVPCKKKNVALTNQTEAHYGKNSHLYVHWPWKMTLGQGCHRITQHSGIISLPWLTQMGNRQLYTVISSFPPLPLLKQKSWDCL